MPKRKNKQSESTSVLSDASNAVMKKLHNALLKLNSVLEDSIKKTKPAASKKSNTSKKKPGRKPSKLTKLKKTAAKKLKKTPGRKPRSVKVKAELKNT